MEFSTTIDNFVIREATESDVPLIMEFVRGLATYEKLEHEVVATEADLQESIFGKKPVAEVLLGFEDDSPVCFALFFRNFSTFLGRPGLYLEDLFVKPESRGRGFGGQMLSCLARIAVDRDWGRLEWSVLDWNESAIKFYESMGARSMNGWIVNRVTGDALQNLASRFASGEEKGSGVNCAGEEK